MPVRLAVLRSQICLDKIPCHCRAHGPASHAEYVHVIIFDTLSSREVIVDESSANARHLVGYYGRTDATAANSYASIHLARRDGICKRHHEVGIVVLLVQTIRTEVHDLVPSRIQFGHDFFFESESTMIGSDSNPHAISLSPLSVRSPVAALSASNTALLCSTRPAGIDWSAVRSRLYIVTFSLPVTNQRMRRARLMTG